MSSSLPTLRSVFCAVLLILFAGLCISAIAEENSSSFDHFKTGFSLDGLHQQAECGDCHVKGVFLGTPRECELCHSNRMAISGSIKPTSHLRTTDLCGDCHSPLGWDVIIRVEHASMIGSCVSCHNNTVEDGKPGNHINSSNECELCHTANSWTALVRVDHAAVSGSCSTCHNNVIATGKHSAHIGTTSECDQCHITAAWTPATFDHSGISGSCSSCHNGVIATGKHPAHIGTTSECDQCHITAAWIPATFDHSSISSGCGSCHDGVTATGKPTGHFVLSTPSLDCDSCHSSVSWLPDFYIHTGAYPGDHRNNPSCLACHTTNAEMIPWQFPAHQPFCAACHQNDYKPGPHKKSENPDTFYTVGELKDCAGACHEPPGEHSVNASEF